MSQSSKAIAVLKLKPGPTDKATNHFIVLCDGVQVGRIFDRIPGAAAPRNATWCWTIEGKYRCGDDGLGLGGDAANANLGAVQELAGNGLAAALATAIDFIDCHNERCIPQMHVPGSRAQHSLRANARNTAVIGSPVTTKTSLTRTILAAMVVDGLRQTGFGDDLDTVQIVGPVKLARCNWTIGTLPANADCAIALNRVVAELQSVYDLEVVRDPLAARAK